MTRMLASPWIIVIDDQPLGIDLALLYGVFSEVRIPSGTIYESLPAAIDGHIAGLPEPLSSVFSKLLAVVVNELGIRASEYTAECWSNMVMSVSQKVDYHIDNDENHRRETGKVICPSYGIIFYVGPNDLKIGGTYFNSPIRGENEDAILFKFPHFSEVLTTSGVCVPFKPGRIVIFHGKCPHCIKPFDNQLRHRVALLCNLWQACPSSSFKEPFNEAKHI